MSRRSGLACGKTGFVEGQNCLIAFRWADSRYDQLPVLAAELVGLRVAVLFAAGGGLGACRQSRDFDDSNCLLRGERPGPLWSGRRASTVRAATSREWACSMPCSQESASKSLKETGTRGGHGCLSIESIQSGRGDRNRKRPRQAAPALGIEASYPQGQYGGGPERSVSASVKLRAEGLCGRA